MRGGITNDEYEDRFEAIPLKDTAVWAIHGQVWGLYDDIFTHRMTGKHKPTRYARREIARSILFLQTAAPSVAWESKLSARSFLQVALLVVFLPVWPLSMVALFIAWLCKRVIQVVSGCSAPKSNPHWPFLSAIDFATARQHPTFLAGV